MSENNFPHLNLSARGSFAARFSSDYEPNSEVERIKARPLAHATKIRTALDKMRADDAKMRQSRSEQNLPDIPANKDFILRVPDKVDVDYITHTLGVELVAETEDSLILVSTEDISFNKLYEVFEEFGAEQGFKAVGSSVLDIYDQSGDPRRLESILAPDVYQHWPFQDDQEYVLDVGIQTADSTRKLTWPTIRKRTGETADEFAKRQDDRREEALRIADETWLSNAETRVEDLLTLISHYGGTELSGWVSGPHAKNDQGVVFPDSVQVRIKMAGRGWVDIILNFPHLFDITLPPEVEIPQRAEDIDGTDNDFQVLSPDQNAPAICVIDSGIQEEHKWLRPAIDADTSRCFLPQYDPDDVADYFPKRGHGTSVAGAVLYPREIPKSGTHEPIAWIQNARVLNEQNQLPLNLTPESYLHQVVNHFTRGPRKTKIYNHSINSQTPCPLKRMTAWAAKMDQLSHEMDVLFIQSVGNIGIGIGNPSNPGLKSHLGNSLIHPAQLLHASSRVANPGQSLHSLTVGSVSEEIFEDDYFRSFSANSFVSSAFSRAGYAPPWSAVKPEVVEVGGDLVHSKESPFDIRFDSAVGVELLNSTIWGEPAYSKDRAGTSFATPKVAHIAAHLQRSFPDASPLLYRTLIVHSARWPNWTEEDADVSKILRLIGYGIPSEEKATKNSETLVTLITPDAVWIPSKMMDVYTVRIPEEIRNAAQEARIRIDVTLAYTSSPRRTRAHRTGYMETWLEWESSGLDEPYEEFLNRMTNGGDGTRQSLPWTLHTRRNRGVVEDTSRNRGSLQKDWAVFESYNLPSEFAIAVRAHVGWNHRDSAAKARYCLAVSFEAIDGTLPIYSLIQSEIQTEATVESRINV